MEDREILGVRKVIDNVHDAIREEVWKQQKKDLVVLEAYLAMTGAF